MNEICYLLGMGEAKQVQKILLVGTLITLLISTPLISYESISLPRFCTLLSFGIVLVVMILKNHKILSTKNNRLPLIFAIIFLMIQIVSTIKSELNLSENLMGLGGRQLGLVSSLFITIFFVSAVYVSDQDFMSKLMKYLMLGGLFSGVYGLVQMIGKDPVAWINQYSPVFSFFGNPNFHSAFMGITGTIAAGQFLNEKITKYKLMYFSLFVLALVNIFGSKSIQGYLVLLSGIAILMFKPFLGTKRNVKFNYLYFTALFIGLSAVVLDILQKAPWPSLLYKPSISYRGDFWRAAVNMFSEHPWLGVGPAGFREFYRQSRDTVSASRFIEEGPTDSAHNLFLDLASTGGFFLVLVYSTIMVLTVISALKVVKREGHAGFQFLILFATWVAFVAQSLISLPQIGLILLGWVLSGSIIGYELNTREKPSVKKAVPNTSSFTTLATGLGLILGLSLSLPMVITDAQFRSAINRGDVLALEKSSRAWPQETIKKVYVAQLLREGELPMRSIVIAREAIEFNPLSFEAWRELSLQQNATEKEREDAQAMMKKLDPFNPNLK